MSLRQTLIFLLVLAIVVSGVAWWYANFEQRNASEDVGFQGRAGVNPWLAAERLLERKQLKVHDVRSPAALLTLPEAGMLVLPGNRHALPPGTLDTILAWLENGGRLLVESETPPQPDPLLDMLGVSRLMHDKDGKPVTDTRKFDQRKEPRQAGMIDAEAPLSIELPRAPSLASEDAYAEIAGEFGPAGLMLEYGAGRAIVLNDLEWMSNTFIRNAQHAEFLWQIAELDPPPREAVVYNYPRHLSLGLWLTQHAWAALAGAGFALILWLWRVAIRFGPTAPDPRRSRRRLLDHLRASGRFLWAHGAAQSMLDASREAASRRLAHAHPDLSGASGAQYEQRVAEILGIDPGQTRGLLAPATAARPGDFVRAIGLYQFIHEKLSLKKSASRINKRTS